MELKRISGFLALLAYSFRNSIAAGELICDTALLTTGQIIVKDRYLFQEHKVTTDDGYILTMHRIPKLNGIPILLVHGFLASSYTWIALGRERALAYLLANLGYDVWLGNTRGNLYSRDHEYLDPNSLNAAYWDFSFHEIGKYDLPAMIDYIIEKSGKPKIHYIAHSQGTTSFFAMCSLRADYNNKIRSAHTLAPVAFMEHAKCPLIVALADMDLSMAGEILGNRDISTTNLIFKLAGQVACNEDDPTNMCENLLLLMYGWGSTQTTDETLQCSFGHFPAGASTKQILHCAQLKKYKQFGTYKDFWFATSELYDLSKVTAPVVLYHAKNDWLNDQRDVVHLHALLPNVYKKFLVSEPTYNHLDFYSSAYNNESLYNELIANILHFG